MFTIENEFEQATIRHKAGILKEYFKRFELSKINEREKNFAQLPSFMDINRQQRNSIYAENEAKKQVLILFKNDRQEFENMYKLAWENLQFEMV